MNNDKVESFQYSVLMHKILKVINCPKISIEENRLMDDSTIYAILPEDFTREKVLWHYNNALALNKKLGR